ncbi:MAG: hypothetical protein ACI8SR_003084 [Oceanicoccus sp.]|jgi:hypothetical protein
MNKFVSAIVIIIVCGVGYVFYQYQQIAAEADEQVEKDIVFLESTFRDRSSDALAGDHVNEKYIQTALVLQRVNDKQQFVRHYNSLFIENGVRNCMQSTIMYLQKQATLLEQIWLSEEKGCLP